MNKKNFILRIDEKTLKLIKKWADDEFRSINGQIEYLLNEALKKAGRLDSNSKKENRDSKS